MKKSEPETPLQPTTPVVAASPDIDFIVYHSAYGTEHEEGPYDSETPKGIDRLI